MRTLRVVVSSYMRLDLKNKTNKETKKRVWGDKSTVKVLARVCTPTPGKKARHVLADPVLGRWFM